ncbi:g5660 [Coccomyxa elongata]
METLHRTADGRNFLVLHGDRCDTTVHLSHTATRFLGDLFYDIFVNLNILIKAVRRLFKLPYWSLAAHIHCKSKFAAEVVDRYEHALAAEARRQGTDGVICGHIHCPRIRNINGVLYVNDGDWVDSCSALVEDADGNLEILHWMDHYKEPAESSPARSAERDVSDDVSDTESAVSQQAALLFDVLSLGNSPKRGSLLPREKQESPK